MLPTHTPGCVFPRSIPWELLLGEGCRQHTDGFLQAGYLMGTSPSQLPLELGVFIWTQPEASQMADNWKSSVDSQGISQGKLLQGSHLPWVPSAWLQVLREYHYQPGPWGPPGSLSIFLQPGFPSFPSGVQIESGEEHRGEFLWISQFPALAVSRPAVEAALTQHWYRMSEHEGRSRFSLGSQPGEQMAMWRH